VPLRIAGPVSRRHLGRSAVLGALAAVSVADGLSPTALAARAATAHGKVHLIVGIPYQGNATFQGIPQTLVDEYIARHWLPKHPGVEVTTIAGMGCNGTCLAAADEIAATFTGNGADILEGCCEQFSVFLTAGLLLRLDPFLQRDNVPLSQFPAGQLSVYQTPEGTFALPQDNGASPYAVNLGMLDELGLPYPQADWTYEQATRLWRSVAGKRGKQWVYGMDVAAPRYNWVAHGFGGSLSTPDLLTWTADSPACRQAFSWFIPLFQENVITGQWGSALGSGQAAVGQVSGGGSLQGFVMQTLGMKWDFFPAPVFPAGHPATYTSRNFNAINALTKNPLDLVWDMFKFITLDPGFARLQARIYFKTPNVNSLWPDWIDLLRATVPPLRDKHLEYYPAMSNYSWPQTYVAYNAVQAKAIQDAYFSRAIARQLSVDQALAQQTAQINALVRAGREEQAAQRASLAAMAADEARLRAGQPVRFGPPPRTGAGVPATPAARRVTVDARSGRYLVSGSGGGFVGVADGGVFAAAASTAARASFTCRLTAFRPLTGGTSLVPGAKVGLMARGDLSDSAAAVGVVLASGRGVHLEDRALPGANPNDQRPASAVAAAGLIGATLLLGAGGGAGDNALLRPLWLRLDRDGLTWTAYTSLDGRQWSQAGTPVTVDILGAWVGLFVTSHSPGQYVQAAFDQLRGFSPDTFVQVGTAGPGQRGEE
jgi:hypothetical protein